MSSHSTPPLQDHLLAALPSEADLPKVFLDEQGSASVKYDTLGPLVVNSDGTLSRITNWPNMTEPERERTLRVLLTRNKIRIANREEIERLGPAVDNRQADMK